VNAPPFVHTWDDATPNITRCGVFIVAGVLTTANLDAVTCPPCHPDELRSAFLAGYERARWADLR